MTVNIKPNLYPHLKAGDEIVVTFGAHGTQTAVVQGRTRTGVVKVCKYRAASNSWTKPVSVYAGEIVDRK